MSTTEYEQRKQAAIMALIDWLKAGDALGRSQAQMGGEFMAAFQQAATTAFTEEAESAVS